MKIRLKCSKHIYIIFFIFFKILNSYNGSKKKKKSFSKYIIQVNSFVFFSHHQLIAIYNLGLIISRLWDIHC